MTIALSALSVRSSLAEVYKVPSGSMEPSVLVGDRIIVSKSAYGLRLPFTKLRLISSDGPDRGDVVVLDSKEDDNVQLLKRVVALPGDRVRVREGRVWVNEKSFPIRQGTDALWETIGDREHQLKLSHGGGPAFGPIQVPKGSYLVMGDNRGDSRDGRSFGFISADAIVGQALGVVFRESRIAWETLR